MNKFTSISLYGVDTSGLNFVIEGIWQDQKFEVEMNVVSDQVDDVRYMQFDSNPASNSGFDPFENRKAVKELTKDQRFVNLMEQGKQIRDMLLKVQE